MRTIDLPVRRYLAGASGVLASAGLAIAAGFAARYLLADVSVVPRMLGTAGAMLGVLAILLVWWQKITPRSIVQSLK